MTERVLRAGDQEALVGVVTEPDPDRKRRRIGVILLNAWRVHRVGPHRLHVDLARRMAASGVVVVRLDFSGIGDSPVRRDGLPEVQSVVVETRDAMARVAAEYGLEGFVLGGVCSGASAALWALSEDPLAVGAALVNIVAWDPDEAANDEMSTRAAAGYYLGRAAFDRKRWRRLLSGRSAYRRIARTLGARVVGLFRRRGSGPADAAGRLAKIRQRGAHLALIFSEGDRSVDVARLVLGGEVRERQDGLVQIAIVPRSDHLFTLERSRRQLVSVIERWLLEVIPE